MKNFHTVDDAARRIGITPGRVRQLLLLGTIDGTKPGRDWQISKLELRRYVRQRAKEKRDRG